MKLNRLLISLTPLSVLMLGLSPSKVSIKPFLTNFNVLGPIEVGGEDIEFKGSITPTKYYASIRESFYVYVKGESTPCSLQRKAFHGASSNKAISLTFTIPVKDYCTPVGFSCTFQVVDSRDQELQSFSFDIKPISPSFINSKDYTKNFCSFPGTLVDPDSPNTVVIESFMFNKCLDYFNVDSYYRLSLDGILLNYSCGKISTRGQAYLSFIDYDHLFPDLDDDQLIPEVRIPLKIQNKKGIIFAFPDKMYVNPASLSMSLEPKPGYKQTTNFYLPINGRSKLLDRKFTLEVIDFGHNKTSFNWDIYYTNTRDLFGECSNSDYCVIGEVI